jgi:hypothetical protein
VVSYFLDGKASRISSENFRWFPSQNEKKNKFKTAFLPVINTDILNYSLVSSRSNKILATQQSLVANRLVKGKKN